MVKVTSRHKNQTEWLLDDQTNEGALGASLVQPRRAKLGRDVLEQLGGCREIEEAVALRAVRRVDLLQPLAQLLVACRLVELARHVVQRAAELFPGFVVGRVARSA